MSNVVFKNIKEYLDERKKRSALKRLLKQIEAGFRKHEFKMYLQFIIDNKSKEIVSAEALSRWQKPSGEIVPPVVYIGVMERFGLISKLDFYMLDMACRKLSSRKNTPFSHLSISCNFTRLTISEKDFSSKVKEIVDKYDFDRSKLLIEITEDTNEKNLEVARNNIIMAKELGFRVALDDIGSGYTSLINLCEYPIDVVKMDRGILLLSDKQRGEKLFSGIVSLAHYLNLKVVCEGVETDEQNDFVSRSECDYIQGWYYSKPIDENQADDFAKEYISKF